METVRTRHYECTTMEVQKKDSSDTEICAPVMYIT